MRSYILSLPATLQPVVIIGSTVLAAFAVSSLMRLIFNGQQVALDNGLITSVYGTLGTTYAVLIAFVVSGVWQSFSDADNAVKGEANALTDLIFLIDSFSEEKTRRIRESARVYVQSVVERWDLLARASRDNEPAEEINLDTACGLVTAILSIRPKDAREVELYGQALDVMGCWLDARRSRLRSAKGNTAGALWGLLIAGAFVLFAFHGMFVTHAWAVWAVLLLGFSFVLGLAFYLIYSLDSPFVGKISAGPTPFLWLLKDFEQSNVFGSAPIRSAETSG